MQYIEVPEKFRDNENSWCKECQEHTSGKCGHFLDARDTLGPNEYINWMRSSSTFRWQEYATWMRENWDRIRIVQEHPGRGELVGYCMPE